MTTSNSELRWHPLVSDTLTGEQRGLADTKKPLGDDELFNSALDFANPANPKRDYNKALVALRKLEEDYPRSRWINSSNILIDVIQENIRLRRLRTEAQQEITKLQKQSTETAQENARLKEVIEQSKKVDIEIEEKKREKAR